MTNWVFVYSEHHLSMALALKKKYPKRKFVFISGKPQSGDFIKRIPQDIKYFQTKENTALGFFSLERKCKEIIMKLKSMSHPDEVITFYDTYSFFLYHKHIFKIKWNQVSLIEDGLANFIPISMPSLFNRIIKASINFLLRRYQIPISILCLGKNKKVKKVYSSWPEKVLVHDSMEIINIKGEYESVLHSMKSDDFTVNNLLDEKHMDILMIPPLLKTRNLSKKKIMSFMSNLLNVIKVKEKTYVKLHPAEGIKMQEFIQEAFRLKGLSANFLNPKKPIEYYFVNLETFSLAGSPSTSHIIAVNNFSEKLIDNGIIIPDHSNPFSEKHLRFLSGIKRLKTVEI